MIDLEAEDALARAVERSILSGRDPHRDDVRSTDFDPRKKDRGDRGRARTALEEELGIDEGRREWEARRKDHRIQVGEQERCGTPACGRPPDVDAACACGHTHWRSYACGSRECAVSVGRIGHPGVLMAREYARALRRLTKYVAKCARGAYVPRLYHVMISYDPGTRPPQSPRDMKQLTRRAAAHLQRLGYHGGALAVHLAERSGYRGDGVPWEGVHVHGVIAARWLPADALRGGRFGQTVFRVLAAGLTVDQAAWRVAYEWGHAIAFRRHHAVTWRKDLSSVALGGEGDPEEEADPEETDAPATGGRPCCDGKEDRVEQMTIAAPRAPWPAGVTCGACGGAMVAPPPVVHVVRSRQTWEASREAPDSRVGGSPGGRACPPPSPPGR